MPISRIVLVLVSTIMVSGSYAQTIGALGGIQRSVWRTGGESIAERNRLELGVFVPFQLHTNFVVRNEASFAFGAGGGSAAGLDQISVRSMFRFYPEPRFHASAGLDVHLLLGRSSYNVSESTRVRSNVLDITPFLGFGMRVSEKSEIGLRGGIGVLAKVEVPDMGMARDHQFSLIYGYTLRGALPGFSKRRMWRRSFRAGARSE